MPFQGNICMNPQRRLRTVAYGGFIGLEWDCMGMMRGSTVSSSIMYLLWKACGTETLNSASHLRSVMLQVLSGVLARIL